MGIISVQTAGGLIIQNAPYWLMFLYISPQPTSWLVLHLSSKLG